MRKFVQFKHEPKSTPLKDTAFCRPVVTGGSRLVLGRSLRNIAKSSQKAPYNIPLCTIINT